MPPTLFSPPVFHGMFMPARENILQEFPAVASVFLGLIEGCVTFVRSSSDVRRTSSRINDTDAAFQRLMIKLAALFQDFLEFLEFSNDGGVRCSA